MFLFVFANLLVVPLFFIAHPHWRRHRHHLFVPGIHGGANSTAVLLIIAIVGTTVAPWQLFFQQSNIVDKRITPRWINYERVDTLVGRRGGGRRGRRADLRHRLRASRDAATSAHSPTPAAWPTRSSRRSGPTGGTFFAVVLLNASLIGAGAVTLATSYVVGDVFGTRGSLHRSFREAKGFYAVFVVLIVAAAAIVLIPGAPLGVINEAVQALCGILLPMTTLFLLMLCNDREVLGPWTNPPWLKALASVIVGVLVLLSVILTTSTIFPHIDVTALALGGGALLVVVLARDGRQHAALVSWRGARHRDRADPGCAQGAMDDAARHAAVPTAVLRRAAVGDVRPRRVHGPGAGDADRQVGGAGRRLTAQLHQEAGASATLPPRALGHRHRFARG